MIRQAFVDKEQIAAERAERRFVASQRPQPQTFPLTDYAADMLSGGGALVLGDAWTAWDWLRFLARWSMVPLVGGPLLLLALECLAPWSH